MLLNLFSRKILKRNKILHNSFKGETCYLFGNGYSLKYLDLQKFKNLNVFSTGLNYLHKDYNSLKVVADFHLHPGIFSPIWKHPYSKKLIFENKTRKFLIKTKRISNEINFFTSIYNYPFISKKKNIFFLHNFNKNFDLNNINPADEFSLMMGSLYAMLGVGVYMGFKEFVFVGMDYLSSKPRNGHFYEFGVRKEIIRVNDYTRRVKLLTNFFERKNNCKFFFLSLQDLTSSIYENISYESQFNSKKQYKENFEIISPEILDDLSDIEFKYLIYEK